MANDKRIRAAKRQRSLVRTVLLFSAFLLVCLVGVMYLLQFSDRFKIRESQRDPSVPQFVPIVSGGRRQAVWMTLYFRQGDTPYLAAEHRQVDVPAGESIEAAAVARLIEGPQSHGLSALIGKNIELLSTEAQGDTLYLDFSDTILFRPINNPSDRAIDAKLRLTAQSIANTAIDCGRYARVQIYVNGAPPKRSDFGFDTDNANGDRPLPALGFTNEVVMDAQRALESALDAAKNRDWQALARMLATDAGVDLSSSGAETLRKNWENLPYRIIDWEVAGRSDGAEELFRIDLHYLHDDGHESSRAGIPVKMSRENETWKVSLEALNRLIEIPDRQ